METQAVLIINLASYFHSWQTQCLYVHWCCKVRWQQCLKDVLASEVFLLIQDFRLSLFFFFLINLFFFSSLNRVHCRCCDLFILSCLCWWPDFWVEEQDFLARSICSLLGGRLQYSMLKTSVCILMVSSGFPGMLLHIHRICDSSGVFPSCCVQVRQQSCKVPGA